MQSGLTSLLAILKAVSDKTKSPGIARLLFAAKAIFPKGVWLDTYKSKISSSLLKKTAGAESYLAI